MISPRGERPNILRSSARVIGRNREGGFGRDLLIALLVLALLLISFFTLLEVLD